METDSKGCFKKQQKRVGNKNHGKTINGGIQFSELSGFPVVQSGITMNNIFRHLSVQDLKNCRLVSKSWKYEATFFLRKRTEVVFNIWNYIKKNDEAMISRYIDEMKGFHVQNWFIHIPPLPTLPNCDQTRKLETDINWLLNQASETGQTITALSLDVDLTSEWNFDMLHQFLTFCSPFLERLEIMIHLHTVEGGFERFPEILFPRLHELRITMTSDVGRHDCTKLVPWWRKILQQSQALKSLTFDFRPSTQVSFLKEIPVVGLPFLEIVQMRRCDTSVIKVIASLPQRLRKLELDFVDEESLPALEVLLNNRANTLEHLSIIFCRCKRKDASLTFPKFPKLKTLLISCENSEYDDITTSYLPVIQFCGENVFDFFEYTKHLPVLRTLQIWPLNMGKHRRDLCSRRKGTEDEKGVKIENGNVEKVWETFGRILHPFISAGGICDTLLTLDIPYAFSDADNHGDSLLPPCKIVEMISKRFPKVWNPWLRKARQDGVQEFIFKSPTRLSQTHEKSKRLKSSRNRADKRRKK